MPSISYDSLAAWSNYHLTLGTAPPRSAVPSMTIESLATVHAADVGHLGGLERFAATGASLMRHLTKLADTLTPPPPGQPRSFAAGLVGRGWSFSPLIGTPVSMLRCDGLAGTAALDAADWHADCSIPADQIALTSGGTRLRELVGWAEQRNQTIRTSGTHLGPTVAGGACTASHGSRLGYGGIQNMIHGMHLIVGDREHVWIERGSSPVLSEDGLRRLAITGATLTHISEDDAFEDALIHLGGMGIVNGVALELVPNAPFALMRRRAPVDVGWLEEIGRGEFDHVARRLQCAARPIFYEITLSPQAPFQEDAAHIMYFAKDASPPASTGGPENLRPADAIGRLNGSLEADDRSHEASSGWSAAARNGGISDSAVIRTLRLLLKGHGSVFDYYLAEGRFEANGAGFDPNDPKRPAYSWSGLHGDEITGNMPGALYNASFAIPLERVATAVPAICEAVRHLEPTFVFTLRFVSRAAGTLAFTRFTDCAVIEIDGLSPLICKLASAGLDPELPNPEEIRAALAVMEGTLPKGASAVRRALEAINVPYSMHWAKLGDLDRAKVHADYGHPADPDASLIRRWRLTRDRLLPPLGRRLFWNDALISFGLLDRKDATPT